MTIPASVHDTIPIADPCCFQCRSCNPRRFPHQERLVCLQLHGGNEIQNQHIISASKAKTIVLYKLLFWMVHCHSYCTNCSEQRMLDCHEVWVWAGGELVVDLVAEGGPVVHVAPESLRDVEIKLLMDPPGEGGSAAQTKVIPPRLILLLL